MDTTTPPINPVVGITQAEWSSRKLSSYGYFSSIIDLLYLILNFAAMSAIVFYMIPSSPSQGVIYFWQILITVFFIQGMKKIVALTNPLNSYQTIIIRK